MVFRGELIACIKNHGIENNLTTIFRVRSFCSRKVSFFHNLGYWNSEPSWNRLSFTSVHVYVAIVFGTIGRMTTTKKSLPRATRYDRGKKSVCVNVALNLIWHEERNTMCRCHGDVCLRWSAARVYRVYPQLQFLQLTCKLRFATKYKLVVITNRNRLIEID